MGLGNFGNRDRRAMNRRKRRPTVGPGAAGSVVRSSTVVKRRRRGHPDDHLKRLARGGGAAIAAAPVTVGEEGRDPYRSILLVFVGVVLLLAGVVWLPYSMSYPDIIVSGLKEKEFLIPDKVKELHVEFRANPAKQLEKLQIRLDGRPANVVVGKGYLTWVIPPLEEGLHTLELTLGKGFLWRSATHKVFKISIDSVNPTLSVDKITQLVEAKKPLVITGKAESNSHITVNENEVKLTDGHFAYEFGSPPVGVVRVKATDDAGNVTLAESRTGLVVPDLIGLYLPADQLTNPAKKNEILNLCASGKINSVVIDVKDEAGRVPYLSKVAMAKRIGAVAAKFDLEAVVAQFHAQKCMLIGRVVTLRDTIATKANIANNAIQDLVQNGSGAPYLNEQGFFLNPISPVNTKYAIDLGTEAATRGVDVILYENFRRPEGAEGAEIYPGAQIAPRTTTATNKQSVQKRSGATVDSAPTTQVLGTLTVGQFNELTVEFLHQAAQRLQTTKARLAASVTGLSIIRNYRYGQDPVVVAKNVDYLVPIIFPAAYKHLDHNIVDPANTPFNVVDRSLRNLRLQTEGLSVVVVPWLQSFTPSGGRAFGSLSVAAEVKAAFKHETRKYLLWNAGAKYAPSSFDPPPTTTTNPEDKTTD